MVWGPAMTMVKHWPTVCSDHKPVVARLRFDRRCLMYKQPKRRLPQTAYDTSRLVSDEETRHAHLLPLNERISGMPTSFDPNARLEDVLRCVKDAATETVGMATSPTYSTDTTPKIHW